MKAIIIVDVNDDSNLESEADVIIDNGDFHLETKAFLKPMPQKKKFRDEFMKVNRKLEMLGGAWNEGVFYEVEESLSKQIKAKNILSYTRISFL